MFSHNSGLDRSLTLAFEQFRFWLRIRGDIRNRKSTPLANWPHSFWAVLNNLIILKWFIMCFFLGGGEGGTIASASTKLATFSRFTCNFARCK
jgi:hypothetical protein